MQKIDNSCSAYSAIVGCLFAVQRRHACERPNHRERGELASLRIPLSPYGLSLALSHPNPLSPDISVLSSLAKICCSVSVPRDLHDIPRSTLPLFLGAVSYLASRGSRSLRFISLFSNNRGFSLRFTCYQTPRDDSGGTPPTRDDSGRTPPRDDIAWIAPE